METSPSKLRRIWINFLGTVSHPTQTFARLAEDRSLLVAAAPPLIWYLLALANGLLRTAVHGPQIGTEPLLPDPTFVGGYGYLTLTQEAYRAGWGHLFIILLLPSIWILTAGITKVSARLWGSQGSFDAALASLSYAFFVPWVLIQSTSEIIFGVPLNLITGTPFFWADAMAGKFGPTVALIWNGFVYVVYSFVCYGWSLTLMAFAIHKTQGLKWFPAILTAVIAFFLAIFFFSTYVR